MKILSLLMVCLVLTGSASAQNVGIGTNSPNNSAQLDVSSTSKGMLAPRMTTVQRNAIATPAKGLLVYDTDLNNLYHYNGNAWATVGDGGGLNLPYAATPGLAGTAFKIDNTGTAIQGTSTALSGYGIYGVNNVSGGFGVVGQSVSGTAVYGNSAGAGTALRGVSSSGYALNTTGNIRISGGNTNPSAGAVLTSVDASGNAIWKATPKIAFRAYGVYNGLNVVPNQTTRKVHFSTEQYDYSNAFQITNSASPTTDMANFVVPVAGVYHFEAGVSLQLSNYLDDFTDISIEIMVKRGANSFKIAYNSVGSDALYGPFIDVRTSTDYRLLPGDDVFVQVWQSNDASVGAYFVQLPERTYFSSSLVIEE